MLATAPAAPTGLSVVTLGVNTFRLTWTDNSTDESFFGIKARLVGQTGWASLDTVAPATGSGSVVTFHQITGELLSASVQFEVVAVKSGTPQEESPASNIVTAATTPASSTFAAPTGLSGTATDGTITFTWNDNANSEWGYEVESREGTTGSFASLGTTNPNQNTNLSIGGHKPDTVYQYRVRATKHDASDAVVTTGYSNTFTISTQPLIAPTNLVATRTNERDIALAQTENSSAESGYQIEYRVAGTSDWAVLGTVGANVSTITAIGNLFDPATDYEIRTRAFYGDASAPEQYSDPSNTAAATTIFHAPSNLAAAATSASAIQLTWQDNSLVEQGIALYVRPSWTNTFSFLTYANADAESFTVPGLDPGTLYEFYVASAYVAHAPTNRTEVLVSTNSNLASVATRDALTGATYVEAVLGVDYNHVITTSTNATLVSSSVTGLPSGLGYNPTNRTVAGTAAEAGVFECPVALEFSDGWTQNTTLTVRVLRPPLAGAAIGDRSMPPAGTASIPLAGHFTDPDAESAVTVSTNIGDMNFVLFNSTTPLTVSNFMAYATAGDYADTVFHRSVPGFVVQGGAFRPDPGNGPTAYVSVPTRPQVPNEPGLSSVRGTIAMAKLGAEAPGGGPDSATNQFFVNLANNGPILNNQNGGFTVFGRVTLPGMAVADQMATLPRGNFNILLNGTAGGFEDWPLTAASQTMDNSLAVKIGGVQSLPVLSYSVFTNTVSGVASAVVNAGSLELQALHGGTTQITVRATDLDGNHVDQTFTVTVPLTYAGWIADFALPPEQAGALHDADAGSVMNLAEFAFMGSPTNKVDDLIVKPVFALVATNRMLTVEFNVRKNAYLSYTVRSAPDLSPASPVDVWNSFTNGVSAVNVDVLADTPTHVRVRVRDTTPPPGADQRHLFLDVREP